MSNSKGASSCWCFTGETVYTRQNQRCQSLPWNLISVFTMEQCGILSLLSQRSRGGGMRPGDIPHYPGWKVSFYWNIRVYRKFCLKIEPHYFTWHFKCFVSFLKHKMQKLHKLKPSLHLDMWALVMTSSFLFPNCHSENHTLDFKTMQVLCACLGQSVAK